MTKGMIIDPTIPRLSVLNGPRLVSSTDGTLFNMLPTVYQFNNQTVSFPDFLKDYLYYWKWQIVWDRYVSNLYHRTNSGQVFFTAIPQYYAQTSVLMAAPAGADVAFAKVNLSRTTAPANTWQGDTIAVDTVQSQWIPFTGSMMLERSPGGPGMSRAFHVYIDDNHDLVIEKEQSVGAAPDGWGTFVNGAITLDQDGSEVTFGSVAGIPIWTSGSSPYFKSSNSDQSMSYPPGPSPDTKHRRTGSDPCSTVDPTNHASTYDVSVHVQFGRRS